MVLRSCLRWFCWAAQHPDDQNNKHNEPPDKGNILAYRHSRGANVLFFDGHGQWMAESFLRYDPKDATTLHNKRQWEPKAR